MKNSFLIIFLITFFFSISNHTALAQQTAIYNNPQAEYRLAIELFNKEKYSASQEYFAKVIDMIISNKSEMKTNAEYYDAICAYELYNKNADFKLYEFIKHHSESSKLQKVYFTLANLYFRNKKYKKAIEWYNKVDKPELNAGDIPIFDFNTAYCFLMMEENELAKKAFSEILLSDNEYTSQANYYFSHLSYLDDEYDTALIGFQKLTDDQTYREIVPYYIAQIYYLQGKYEELMEIAPQLFENSDKVKKSNIASMIGDTYYKSDDFENALPYLEYFQNNSKHRMNRNNIYHLAFTYYKTEDYENAINQFQKITSKEDSLSQNAHYHLADSYLKTGQKEFAANEFYASYMLPFNPQIKEDALFNYAKLSMESKYNPYNKAIPLLEQYINDYPNSSRSDEAYGYIFELVLTTKNYTQALLWFDKIKIKTPAQLKEYQKISYYRGVELFNQNKFNEAIKYFKQSNSIGKIKLMSSKALFWIADANYHLKNYSEAGKYFRDFIKKPGIGKLEIYPAAHYNLGYAYFNLKDYNNAVASFRNFVDKKKTNNDRMLNDAYLRIGDSYFINKKYNDAIKYYDDAIKIHSVDNDYALYQKALALGALGKFQEKIKVLQQLIASHNKSPYIDNAKYEIATTYLVSMDNANALKYFKMVVSDHPSSRLKPKALMKSGLIYYENNQNEKAIESLKTLINGYPGSPDSKEALRSLRTIYIDMNKVDEYIAYANTLEFSNVSISEQDSITYIVAENLYMDGDFENSITAFRNYLTNFPKGSNIFNANFYKAECEFHVGSKDKALIGYEYIISQPASRFTETSLSKTSDIYFNEKEYQKALETYEKLEQSAEIKSNILKSIDGQMRCNYILENNEEAKNAASRILTNDKVTSDQINFAHLIIAKSNYALGDIEAAKREFQIASHLSNDVIGAEAKFFVAQIDYEEGNFEESGKTIFELIKQFSAYDYWVAKSFILLSDVYQKIDNSFQAKQTLQSIIDNYDGEDLKKIAQDKLKLIIESEEPEETGEN